MTPRRRRLPSIEIAGWHRSRTQQKVDERDSNVSGGAGDMFLMVKGAKHGLIKGESQDDQHKGEIEVAELVLGHAGASDPRRRHAPPGRPPSTSCES